MAKISDSVYKIDPGENLSIIAKKLGTTIQDIQKYNTFITDPNKVPAGQTIVIPKAQQTSVAPQQTSVAPQQVTLEQARLAEELTNKTNQLAGTSFSSPIISSDPIIQNKQEEIKKTQEDAIKKANEIEKLRLDAEIKALKDALAGGVSRPQGLDRVETYTSLIKEKDEAGYTVSDYQQQVVDLYKERADAIAQLQNFKRGMVGVSEGFAQGTISREQQSVQDKIDFIDRQINTLNLQVQNRNNVISTIMELKDQDYTSAMNEYDKEFSQNVQIYNAINQRKNIELTQEEKQQDNARAALQVILDQMQSGNLNYDDLQPQQKIVIDDLEIQGGFPVGFTQFIKSNIKGNIISTGSRTDNGNEYFDILTKDENGAFKVHTIYRGKATTTNKDDEEKQIEEFKTIAKDERKKIEDIGTKEQYEKSFRYIQGLFPFLPNDIIYRYLGEELQ